MVNKYYYKLQDISTEDTHVVQKIQVGSKSLTLTFQWATASEEQCNMILKYLADMAKTDPIQMSNGNYVRDYDWLNYYVGLSDVDLNDWLDSVHDIPVAIVGKDRDVQIRYLQYRIGEALSITSIIRQYIEVMRWQVTVTGTDVSPTACLVELGGWNRHQDNAYSFRFLSGREYIGRNDLNELYIEFEVYE